MDGIPQNLRMSLKEAKDLLESGRADAAEKAREILLDLPDAAEYGIYHLLLAKAAKDLNQMDTAIAHLEKSLELKSDNLQALLRVAEHKLKRDAANEAVVLLQRAVSIARDGGDAKTACKIAALLIKANEGSQAIEFLTYLSNRFPNDKEVSHTLSLAFRQQGQDERYEEECLNAIQKTTVESSVKQRIGLAKHYLSKSGYAKVIGLITPLENLDYSSVSMKNAGDIVNSMLALAHCEMKSLDIAKQKMIEVKNQSSILANYVWAAIQMSEKNIEAALDSCVAIKMSAEQKIIKMNEKKNRAQEMVASKAREEIKQRSEKILKTHASTLEEIAAYSIGNTYDDIKMFLNAAHPLVINTLPG